mmetsp:Transcript_1151/g.5076  ORF Transcript_1151/g.5076 Transcript_1151/m.5076 type:complete len:306 (+) Transcript_1151:115-1032(+)
MRSMKLSFATSLYIAARTTSRLTPPPPPPPLSATGESLPFSTGTGAAFSFFFSLFCLGSSAIVGAGAGVARGSAAGTAGAALAPPPPSCPAKNAPTLSVCAADAGAATGAPPPRFIAAIRPSAVSCCGAAWSSFACALVMESNSADMSSHSSCWKNQMPLTSVDDLYRRYGGESSNSNSPKRSSRTFSVFRRFSTTNWNLGTEQRCTTKSEPSQSFRCHACSSRLNPYRVTWLALPRMASTSGSSLWSTRRLAASSGFTSGFFRPGAIVVVCDATRRNPSRAGAHQPRSGLSTGREISSAMRVVR